ncbi:DUF2989 domain-containing protein [Aestuariibacter sp. AA17]|uniref:DUF2989 domain-containing protein n=1 Tax=Fluctibacter corallii TaxID=2984329 RepID=A0ABT3A4C2_9ALTE|nr:DUF2989 domain-containing protein [Aestuariibacter sp. AA17]MCV2883530.1 DUF2989 domain-containing protein [Aestuariibacter sp. AA17]
MDLIKQKSVVNPLLILISLLVLLQGCEKQPVSESSIWTICDEYGDICDSTHSGALCTIPRSDTIKALAIHREKQSSLSAYEALSTLDKYKVCLEDAYISENIRRKKDKQSQMQTIVNIPEMQKQIIKETNGIVRPEVNLWLWKKTQKRDYLESMMNGVDMVKQVHTDVFVALMMEFAAESPERARTYAKKALKRADVISDIQPRVYEFYVGYYLNKGDKLKAAIWQGLYSARDEQQAKINADYFKLYQNMSDREINKAQKEVDSLLFDAKWLSRDMSAFPKKLI